MLRELSVTRYLQFAITMLLGMINKEILISCISAMSKLADEGEIES